jgi:hypothetical protein
VTLKKEHSKLGLPGYYDDDEDPEGAARSYIGWAPGDDYMSSRGWAENKEFESWAAFKDGWGVDGDVDMNLIADFYFTHAADSRECEGCEGRGYGPEAQKLNDTFHRGWSKDLTKDEIDTLVAEGRHYPPGPLGHDAINRHILVQARAKRLGVTDPLCAYCKGKGRIDIEPENLIFFVWMLHPRKGCGRGLTIKNIKEADFPEIKAWLKKSYESHTNHFKWALLS